MTGSKLKSKIAKQVRKFKAYCVFGYFIIDPSKYGVTMTMCGKTILFGNKPVMQSLKYALEKLKN